MDDPGGLGTVRIDDLVVDRGARTVTRGGEPIEMPRLSFDLLLALVEAAPDALSTETLMERVWTGRVVSPATVAKRVELLRQALGDDAAEPRYVTLVRGYGYRLAQAVVPTDRAGNVSAGGGARGTVDPDSGHNPDPNPGPKTDPNPGPKPDPNPGSNPDPALGTATGPAPGAEPGAEPGPAPAAVGRDPSRGMPLAYLAVAALVVAAAALFLLLRGDDPAPPPERSVAVLPFEALGDDRDEQMFADGLTEEIAHALARTGELRVTGRTSALAFRGATEDAVAIGEALGVATLLEGTVRRQDDRLRIVARLTDTKDGFQLWSEVFEAPAADTSRLHRQVAQRIAERFQLDPVASAVPDAAATSSDPEAYALYLQAVSQSGIDVSDGPVLERAQALIEEVVERDPGFALGWTRLAIVHGQRLFYDRSYPLDRATSIRTIRSAIDRALAIDPNQGEAYTVLAGVAWIFERDLERAARLYEQALRLDPWNLTTVRMVQSFTRGIGDLELSRDLAAYVVRRDPLCPTCRAAYAGVLACLGEYEAAAREIRKVRDEQVEMPLGYRAGVDALRAGRLEEAANLFRRLGPEMSGFRRLGDIRLLIARGGTDEARRALAQHIADHPGWGIEQARLAAKLGDGDLAVERLRSLLPQRFVWVQTSVCAPAEWGLESNANWQALMRELGRNPDGSPTVTLEVPPLPGAGPDRWRGGLLDAGDGDAVTP